MSAHRLTEAELWARIELLQARAEPFFSVVEGKQYKIVDVDRRRSRYQVEYESGNPKWVQFDKLYAVYGELYRLGTLPRSYMRDPENSLRVVGDSYWHAPGATIYALIHALDENVQALEGGHLHVGTVQPGERAAAAEG